jgi:MFS family permease
MMLNYTFLRLPGMGKLLIGYVLSVIADTSVYIVFAVWAKQLTGSTAGAGLVFFCFIIPSLISPLTGNIIDNLRKDHTIVFTNIFMAATILTLYFSPEKNQYTLLLTSAFVYGLGYVVFNSARVCIVVNSYDKHHIGQINAVLRTLRETVRLTAPLFGVYIYTTLGNHVFVWFVSLSLIFSACLFINFEKKNTSSGSGNGSAFSLRGLWDGIWELWSNPLIRSCVVCLSVTLLVAGFYEIILFSIIDYLHQPLAVIGQLISAQGIGAVMGGLASMRLIKNISSGVLISAGLFIQVTGMLGLFSQDMVMIYISCAVFGFGAPISMVGLDTLIQTTLPPAVQGRANTSLEAITSIPFSLSFLISSLMTTVISYKIMLLSMVIVTVSAAIFLLLAVKKVDYTLCYSRDDDPKN